MKSPDLILLEILGIASVRSYNDNEAGKERHLSIITTKWVSTPPFLLGILETCYKAKANIDDKLGCFSDDNEPQNSCFSAILSQATAYCNPHDPFIDSRGRSKKCFQTCNHREIKHGVRFSCFWTKIQLLRFAVRRLYTEISRFVFIANECFKGKKVTKWKASSHLPFAI